MTGSSYGNPQRMPRWHARCVRHDWPTCIGWCPGCAQDHHAGKHSCQQGVAIGDRGAHEHHVDEHPHTCPWCYPLPAYDRPSAKSLSGYHAWRDDGQ